MSIFNRSTIGHYVAFDSSYSNILKIDVVNHCGIATLVIKISVFINCLNSDVKIATLVS